jgi:GntR family transcriptional regulator, vanillate catabolism transcriptional regulator
MQGAGTVRSVAFDRQAAVTEMDPLQGDEGGGVPQNLRALLGLRDLLINGAFQPGEKLSEIPLGKRLGVSRTPLRLALSSLEHEGLLEAHPSGGFVVRAFGVEDAIDAIEIRGVLEGTAARLAAERLADPARLDTLRSHLSTIDELLADEDRPPSDVFADYVVLNERFHVELVHVADSGLLARSLQHATTLPFASPNAFVETQAQLPIARRIMVVAQEHHRAIVEAIAGREGTRAEAVAREHARLARRNLEAAIAAGGGLDTVPGASLIRVVEDQTVEHEAASDRQGEGT